MARQRVCFFGTLRTESCSTSLTQAIGRLKLSNSFSSENIKP